MAAARIDWSMGSRAAALVDWSTARETGRRIAGPGPQVVAADRARIREDIAAQVPRAEMLVSGFTGLRAEGPRARPWVMSRSEWIAQNLNGLERLLEPLAERVLPEGSNRSELRRKALGAQIGALLGYVSRKVLGQYDVFLPPDDEGSVYFVGPNMVETERRFALAPSDFRLWVALHEVTHRIQFGATPWLRGFLAGQVDTYLATVEVDSKQFFEQLRRAVEELRAGGAPKGAGGILLLMTPEQRELFKKMQSMMSLLEGHASFVMNEVGRGQIHDLDRLRRSLKERRRSGSMEKTLQRAIGFDQKIRQYDIGEAFVRTAVERVGMDGFNLVWREEGNLPTLDEVVAPERWIARVAGG
jgi:coenzyme F420 biosynthesis associated uncharacterized protein